MIIRVKVKPGSEKDEIIFDGTKYVAYLIERAENNKANLSLIKMISKKYKVSYKKIKIKNPKSREKIIEIDI